jgi:anti-sigma factor RsiW
MTERCTDLDEFFDGELAADQANVFWDHLATCERCQEVLHGRMQESVVAHVHQAHAAPAVTAPDAAAPAVVPRPGPPATAAPAMAREPARRPWSYRRAVVYAAPLLAAAAAVPLWLGHRSEPAFELSLAIDRAPAAERGAGAGVPRRGLAAHTGDVLRPTVRGERHQAIWVYLDERDLILRCPDDVRCRSADGELALELPLTTRGRYAIIAVGSGEALPAPGPTLDRTLATARTAGVHTQIKYVDVD